MNDLKGIIEDCNKSDLVSDRVIKKVIEIIGQEEWQILHDENNDVCTTMGELIITLKRIADLEEENVKLKSIADFQQSGNMSRYFELKRQGEQLTKAKEELQNIIQAFVGDLPRNLDYFDEEELKAIAEAEQFIKE